MTNYDQSFHKNSQQQSTKLVITEPDDNRVFASYVLPPKINLLESKPRRESLVERELEQPIIRSQSRANDETSNLNQNNKDQQPRNMKRNATTSHDALLKEFVRNEQKLLDEIEAVRGGCTYSPKTGTWCYTPSMPRPKSRQEPQPRQRKYMPGSPSPSPSSLARPMDYGFRRSTSRPGSRVSSTRSTTEEDLREREAKLMAEIEDIERKPFKPQTMVVGVKSEDDYQELGSKSRRIPSIHTTVIKVPSRDINNKSPMPFAYDNFSTLGVRGNVASVGATEPEKPYPPIYPIIKRSPSPRV